MPLVRVHIHILTSITYQLSLGSQQKQLKYTISVCWFFKIRYIHCCQLLTHKQTQLLRLQTWLLVYSCIKYGGQHLWCCWDNDEK